MADQDIRWEQRFSNYQKALVQLERAAAIAQTRKLDELEEQGLIKAFEYTYELAWNLLKDYLTSEGISGIQSPKGAIREAFARGYIVDGDGWLEMVKSRNLTSHTYDSKLAGDVAEEILHSYLPKFRQLRDRFIAI